MCRFEWLSVNDFIDERDDAVYCEDKAAIRRYRLHIALLRRKYKNLSSLPIFGTMHFRPRNASWLRSAKTRQRP